MKVGDRVIMVKGLMPKSEFRTGIVKQVSSWSDEVKIKRDNYRGHEYTWWSVYDWRVIPKKKIHSKVKESEHWLT